jgi:hypothetical protein
MIQSIRFKFGAAPNSKPLSLEQPRVVVFVGPNNSGKSRALIEIAAHCQSGQPNAGNVIIESLSFSPHDEQFALASLERSTVVPLPNEAPAPHQVMVQLAGSRISLAP